MTGPIITWAEMWAYHYFMLNWNKSDLTWCDQLLPIDAIIEEFAQGKTDAWKERAARAAEHFISNHD